ncbi:hypothetical protein Pfo_031238 [Paulownia fortunei]|nr:hypothetical protein Pfo_031238 [Paulownia fortunei]
MVGFFLAYIVDALAGLNVVGQTGKEGKKIFRIYKSWQMRQHFMTSNGKHRGKIQMLAMLRKRKLVRRIN